MIGSRFARLADNRPVQTLLRGVSGRSLPSCAAIIISTVATRQNRIARCTTSDRRCCLSAAGTGKNRIVTGRRWSSPSGAHDCIHPVRDTLGNQSRRRLGDLPLCVRPHLAAKLTDPVLDRANRIAISVLQPRAERAHQATFFRGISYVISGVIQRLVLRDRRASHRILTRETGQATTRKCRKRRKRSLLTRIKRRASRIDRLHHIRRERGTHRSANRNLSST